MKTCDAVIIGGGLVGLMTARELIAAGMKVKLFDRSDTPHAASWAGGGILSPLQPWQEPEPVLRLAQWSQAVYARLANELAEVTGTDPGYRLSGMLMLDTSDPETIHHWADRYQQPIEVLTRGELRAAEPALSGSFESAILLPAVAQIRNPRLLRALISELGQRGVMLEYGRAVERLLIEARRCTGVMVDGERHAAEHVIICAGAWSSALLPDMPVLRPVKGQILAYRLPPDRLRHLVLHHLRYLIPRADGLVLAGSTLEEAGFDTAATAEAATSLQAHARQLLPELAGQAPSLHWTGLRPATSDGLPLIGRHADIAGLYLNTGHFRNGILLAPASARLLADLLLQREPVVPPAPYAPTRVLTQA